MLLLDNLTVDSVLSVSLGHQLRFTYLFTFSLLLYIRLESVVYVVRVQHDTTRTFFMTVEAPQAIRRGEQVGLRLDLFNNWDQDLEVTSCE